jgi:hypothetical protein
MHEDYNTHVCIYTYTYIYIYIHTHTYIYVYTHIHTHIHTLKFVDMPVCVCARVCAYVCFCVYDKFFTSYSINYYYLTYCFTFIYLRLSLLSSYVPYQFIILIKLYSLRFIVLTTNIHIVDLTSTFSSSSNKVSINYKLLKRKNVYAFVNMFKCNLINVSNERLLIIVNKNLTS